MTLNGTSTVSNNTVGEAAGIFNVNGGTLNLNDTSTISNNTALGFGGGVIWRRPKLTARGDPDHDQVVAGIVARLAGAAAPGGGEC